MALPASVETIGEEAFFGCYDLKRLRLNDGLKTIGSRAFYNCYSLFIDTLPSSLEDVGKGAFYGVQMTDEVYRELSALFPHALM